MTLRQQQQPAPSTPAFDPHALRAAFPMLSATMHDKPLVYLDNAATTQRPRQVIDATVEHWETSNGPVSRGVHALGSLATERYENARADAAAMLGADLASVIFTKGVTDGLNLVASALGEAVLDAGDEVIVTELEHHSNFLPWRRACLRRSATLRVAPITDAGTLDLDAFASMLNGRTKIVAVAHASNVLGTILPIAEIAAMAERVGAVVVADGAQAPGHMPVDVRELGCDFYAVSAHKAFGPAGIGALYAAPNWMQRLEPVQVGGGMVEIASAEVASWIAGPHRFEAGTPNTEGAVGLAAAARFLASIDRDAAHTHEAGLRRQMIEGLAELPGVRVFGPSDGAPLASFWVEGAHPHDVATVLDAEGVAVRAGHMCAQPLMRRLGVPALTRASIAPYNTAEDIDALLAGVRHAIKLLA